MLDGPVKTVQRTNLALKGCVHSSEKPEIPHRPKHLHSLEILDEDPTLTAGSSDSMRQKWKYKSKQWQHFGEPKYILGIYIAFNRSWSHFHF